VAKKKNSMALFEVISKTRDKNPESEVLVPEWVKPGHKNPDAPTTPPEAPPAEESAPPQAEAAEPAAPQAPTSEPEPVEPVASEPAIQETEAPQPLIPEPETQAPEPTEVEAPKTAQAPREPISTTTYSTQAQPIDRNENAEPPMWSTDGERLTLSLNYVSCMVASMGILLLIIGAFVLGRMTASPEAASAPTNQNAIKREVGKYYMVIQRFAGEGPQYDKEAKQAAAFCNANGEPAQVQLIPKVVNGQIVKGKGYLIVWSAKPFDSPRSEEVKAHALFVQNELGAKYAKKYGAKYSFRQTRTDGNLASVMYPYKKYR
jgi:hypothetical protein